MADLKISALNSLAGADLVAADVVAVVDDSASETKKLTVSDLIANGVTLISNSTIPSAKILFSAGSIATASVVDAAVTTAKVADSAITAAKLADNSSVTLVSSLPASGDFTGQVALDTTNDKIYVWDGSAWDSVKAAGSINVVNGSTSGIVNITTSTSGDTVTVSTTLDDTTAAKQFLAGPTGAGGTVGYRAIASGDLPTATSSAKGAVAVNGNGLTMSNDEIQIDNSVTAETTEHHLVQYDANGLITAGRVIAASDLPEATSSAKGAVVPGSGLSVASGGTLNHTNSTTAGTYTKVTVDAQGHVTSAVTLAAADIPDLDAAKITTGTFPTARLADDAVTAAKLADQSVTKFGGAGATDNVVTFPDGDYKGQFFFDEKNEDLYVYTGESFLPITVISGNLVNAGTYDASTNLLSSVTTAGSAAGFTNGAALPAPASGNLNYYVVVDTSGTGSGNAPAVALAPPDMLISLGVAGTTFQLIDVSNAIAGQTAANISVVATGNIAATDVQAALQELDTEKLALAGGTMTGNLELGAGIVIVFEGATDDGFETTLTVADPTADRTITLPNETGTLLTTGSSGVVTSAMITDGTIVNADISASAEIAVSKLANGTARQLLQTDVAGTGVEFTSNVDVPGTFDCTGAGTFDSTLTVTGLISADGKVKFPAGTASAPSLYSGTDTNTGLYFSAADEVSITTGGTQRVAVDSSGRVLVGTDANTTVGNGSKLQIKGSGAADSSFSLIRTAAGGGEFHFAAGTSGTNVGNNNGLGFLKFLGYHTNGYDEYARIEAYVDGTNGDGDAPGRLVFKTSSDGSASPAERMRIDSSGNLGIGTTSPSNKLDVGSGNIEIGGGNNTALTWSADVSSHYLKFTSALNGLTLNGYGGLAFETNGANERMRIDSSGNVGIGTTSPTSKFDVQIASGAGINFTNLSTAPIIDFQANSVESAGRIRVDEASGGGIMQFATKTTGGTVTERMRIDSSGRVLVGLSSSSMGCNVESGTTGGNNFAAGRFAANTGGPDIVLRKSRNATVGSHTIVQNGDDLGNIFWGGSNGSAFKNAARISAQVDGTPGTGDDMPGRLTFYTSADGSISPTERMRIDSSGTVTISSAFLNFGTGGTSGFISANNYYGASSSDWFFNTGHSSQDFAWKLNTGTELARLDSSGRLLIGTTSDITGSSAYQLQIVRDGAANLVLGSSDTTQPSEGTSLGQILFLSKAGSAWETGARITAATDAASGSGDKPTRLVFSTTADGAASPTERLRISSKGVVTVKNSSVGEIDALTSASTITPDFAASNNFSVTLGTNATLANPSNLTAGQSGVIAITQDGTGSRTLAYGSKFKFAGGTAPTLTTTASAVDILTYYVESTSRITAQVLLNVS